MGKNERTLFRPVPTLPQNLGGGNMGPGPVFEPEDEERASLVDLVAFAVRAALRRSRLSLALCLLGLLLTAVAARLLVLHTASSTAAGGGVANAFTADDAKRDAKEFEQQIYARSNLEGIVKDTHLVARWD